MKSFIALIALVVFGVTAFTTTPQIKNPSKQNLARIEEPKKVEVVKHTTKAKEPLKKAPVKPKVTPPKPAPKPAPVIKSTGSCELAHSYSNWPSNVAAAVCMAESSGVHWKINWEDNHGSCVGSYGLMQNGCFWFPFFGYTLEQANDPVVNMKVANLIYQRTGNFGPWTTYTSGKYLQYLR